MHFYRYTSISILSFILVLSVIHSSGCGKGDRTHSSSCTTNHDCLNGGRCSTTSEGTQTCDCTGTKHEGPQCENKIQCPENFCKNGGTCDISHSGKPQCSCDGTKHEGPQCENKIQCPENFCKNGGTCDISHSGKPQCSCDGTKHEGPQCENKIQCPENFCKNGGICDISHSGKPQCSCDGTKYIGPTCSQPITCQENHPCKNGGLCSDDPDTGEFICDCQDTAYVGITCEEPQKAFKFKIKLVKNRKANIRIKNNAEVWNEFKVNIDHRFLTAYKYNIDCNSDGTWEGKNITQDYTCTYPQSNDGDEYVISIQGNFPAITMCYSKDSNTLTSRAVIDVEQWGDINWKSMEWMFAYCDSLEKISASDHPNLSAVDSMERAFAYTVSFTGDLNDWDVSQVVNMNSLFAYSTFEGDLDKWKVGRVTDMMSMFAGSTFNRPIGQWEVNLVTTMELMFAGNTHFNQDLSLWQLDSLQSCDMFSFQTNQAWTGDRKPPFSEKGLNCF